MVGEDEGLLVGLSVDGLAVGASVVGENVGRKPGYKKSNALQYSGSPP